MYMGVSLTKISPQFQRIYIVVYTGSIPDEIIGLFNWPNPSSCTVTLKQPLTEKSTRNISEGKGQPVDKADNLTAICEQIV
jgi:hypothetical protein